MLPTLILLVIMRLGRPNGRWCSAADAPSHLLNSNFESLSFLPLFLAVLCLLIYKALLLLNVINVFPWYTTRPTRMTVYFIFFYPFESFAPYWLEETADQRSPRPAPEWFGFYCIPREICIFINIICSPVCYKLNCITHLYLVVLSLLVSVGGV